MHLLRGTGPGLCLTRGVGERGRTQVGCLLSVVATVLVAIAIAIWLLVDLARGLRDPVLEGPVGSPLVPTVSTVPTKRGADCEAVRSGVAPPPPADLDHDLTGANTRGTDFTGTYLPGAVMTSTQAGGLAIWSSTICPDGSNSDSHRTTCVG